MSNEEAAELAPDPGELEKTEGQLSDADQNSVDTTGSEDQPKGRDRRAERRIHRLTARNAKTAEENAELKSRLDQLESKISALPVSEKARPQREDFESIEEYEDAYFDYRQESKPAEVRRSEPTPNPELANRSQSYIADMDKAQEGFAKVVENATFPLTEHSWNEVMEMGEDGADVFMHLNEHPAEAMRISQLSPGDQTIELEKLTDSLDVTSSAPDPITPVDGNVEPQVDESKLSHAEWIARRNRKVHGR